MNAPYWVLDAGAIMAYVHGVEAVGQILVDVVTSRPDQIRAVLGGNWAVGEV